MSAAALLTGMALWDEMLLGQRLVAGMTLRGWGVGAAPRQAVPVSITRAARGSSRLL